VSDAVHLERARWHTDEQRDAMISIRREVFVVEQEVPI
jgi:predicted GNAT family N-acyltransferase